MRAVVNVVSDRIADATGWRAREVRVAEDNATLEDILRSTSLREGNNTLYDLVTDENGFRSDFSLFISGEFMQGNVALGRVIRDSEQIHIWDWPFSVRDS